MSFFSTIEDDLNAVKVWFEGTPIGAQLKADLDAALKELESVSTADLQDVVKQIGMAVLSGLATGGGTQAAIAAGITAAEAGLKAAGADITKQTIATLTTSVMNQVSTATTPQPVAPPTKPVNAPVAAAPVAS